MGRIKTDFVEVLVRETVLSLFDSPRPCMRSLVFFQQENLASPAFRVVKRSIASTSKRERPGRCRRSVLRGRSDAGRVQSIRDLLK